MKTPRGRSETRAERTVHAVGERVAKTATTIPGKKKKSAPLEVGRLGFLVKVVPV
jgi:hypothetical protein